mmetsp:Transcript_44943/g.90675  ORF Transcript_44943/g.90675 Transcript_44943/m.90675 type:complete len:211 (-) Transcript_44943:763-1395(-)
MGNGSMSSPSLPSALPLLPMAAASRGRSQRNRLSSARSWRRESPQAPRRLAMRNVKAAFQPNVSLRTPTRYCPMAAPRAPMPSMMPVQVDVARACCKDGCVPRSTEMQEVSASAGPPCKTPQRNIIAATTRASRAARKVPKGSMAKSKKMLTTGLLKGTPAAREVQSLRMPAKMPPRMKPQSNKVAKWADVDLSIPIPSLRKKGSQKKSV